MPSVAFLRAINVGGRQVAMAPLRALFESLGFSDVSTYIASGNVRFGGRGRGAALEARIEAALEEEFGFVVETFVRSEAELQAVLDSVPFSEAEVAEAHALMVAFLKGPVSPEVAQAVAALSSANPAPKRVRSSFIRESPRGSDRGESEGRCRARLSDRA